MKNFLRILAIFLVLIIGNAYAFAYTFPLYTGTASEPGTKFEDNDVDYFVNNDGSTNADGQATITAGDFIYSAIEFDRIVDNFGGTESYTLNEDGDELVAISMIKLIEIDDDGVWHFGQIDENTAMVQVYSGGTNNLVVDTASSVPTWTDAYNAVTEGEHLWDFSIDDDPDTFWQFTPLFGDADTPEILLETATGTTIGAVNFQLNQVWGEDIFDPIEGLDTTTGDQMTDIRGSGTLETNTSLVNDAFAVSDIQVFANPIPEPTTFLLFGLGLLGFANINRRRNK